MHSKTVIFIAAFTTITVSLLAWILVNKAEKDKSTVEIYNSIDLDCENEYSDCLTIMRELTEEYGPKKTLEVFSLMHKNNKVTQELSSHKTAHFIGQETAKSFGNSLESYNLCPDLGHFGGCYHGFLEYAIVAENSFERVESEICEAIKTDNERSGLGVFHCYHGIGHGAFMIVGEEVSPALILCDSINLSEDIEACWSGVFNAAFAAHFSDKINMSSPTNVIKNCTNLEEKYQKHCITNIGLLLIRSGNNSIITASQACLTLPEEYMVLCAGSLGSFTTIGAINQTKSEKIISSAAYTCNSFEESIIGGCISGALQRLILDEAKADLSGHASLFCEAISDSYKKDCYKEIGKNITLIFQDLEDKKSACKRMPVEFQEECYSGASI